MKASVYTCVIAGAVLFFLPEVVMAAAGGGQPLPWEGPLTRLADSLTGPVAISIALIAIAAAGAVLIWGGEINRFASMAVYIVIVLGLLVMASNVLQGLYGVGMVIPVQEVLENYGTR